MVLDAPPSPTQIRFVVLVMKESETSAVHVHKIPVDGLLALVAGGTAVQAFVLVAAERQELLHHVQHADELAENQHLLRLNKIKIRHDRVSYKT